MGGGQGRAVRADGHAAQVMREGTDVTLVSFGKLVGYDLQVAEKLEKEGISVEARAYICTLCTPYIHFRTEREGGDSAAARRRRHGAARAPAERLPCSPCPA